MYEYPSATNAAASVINLAYANGFLPQTYTAALRPLFDQHRVVSLHMRPMWQPPIAPETLTHWRQLGADLLTQLDTLTPEPVLGIGHSVGAIATMYAAVTRPERFRALVLLDPTLLPRKHLRGLWLMRITGRTARVGMVAGALKRGRHWDSAEAAYTYFRGKRLFTRFSDEAVRVYSDSLTAPDPNGGVILVFSPEWEARIYQTVPTDVWRLPARLKTPTLVIRGGLSDTFHAEGAADFARLNPRATLITIPDAGHLVAQERPDAVGQAIAEFLKQN
jgi:pimeloyl-ACP methyl ester carboxylesterase